MAKLTLSDLRSAAHTLKHSPRVSSMDDAEFHAGLLQLLANIRPLFGQAKDMANVLAQAFSYESSGHFELSLAAIHGLLELPAARQRNSNRTCPIPDLNKQVWSSDGSPDELPQLHYLFGVKAHAADVYLFTTLRWTDKVKLEVLSTLTGCVHHKRAASGTACVEPHEDLESFAKSA